MDNQEQNPESQQPNREGFIPSPHAGGFAQPLSQSSQAFGFGQVNHDDGDAHELHGKLLSLLRTHFMPEWLQVAYHQGMSIQG